MRDAVKTGAPSGLYRCKLDFVWCTKNSDLFDSFDTFVRKEVWLGVATCLSPLLHSSARCFSGLLAAAHSLAPCLRMRGRSEGAVESCKLSMRRSCSRGRRHGHQIKIFFCHQGSARLILSNTLDSENTAATHSSAWQRDRVNSGRCTPNKRAQSVSPWGFHGPLSFRFHCQSMRY